VLRVFIVILLTARAAANPLTFAVRGGIEWADLTDWKYFYLQTPPRTTAPALDVEAGVWATDNVTLTAVAGSLTRFHVYETYTGSTWSALEGRIGARLTLHTSDTSPPLLLGIGTGATLQAARGDGPREYDVSHYFELFAGASLAHAGPIAFQAMGTLGIGGMATRQLTLGVAWDPPHAKVNSAMGRDWLLLGLHVGKAFTKLDDDYLTPRGWGPWIEAEGGARVSPHLALLMFAAYTHISGDSFLQDIGTKTYTEHYELTDIRVGMRLRAWLVPRAYVAFGAGILMEKLNDSTPGGPFAQLEIGVEPLRFGRIGVEVTDVIDVAPEHATSGFAIGVAYR